MHSLTLLDLPLSLFNTAYANVPSQTVTLRQMVTTGHYRKQIEAIRAETNTAEQSNRKKSLPAFTLALLNHRRKDVPLTEQVCQQWPLLMGDVDQKDNPGLDMGLVKQDLARLTYVVSCAFSVRGGLWFVLRLPHQQTPDTLRQHFGYVKKLFSDRFGIVLDATKGGSPVHLRYVSFDPDPYINDDATILRGMYTAPPPPASTKPTHTSRAHSPDPLRHVLQIVVGVAEGERHQQLLKAARLGGGYVATGHLNETDVIYALETVASGWDNFTKSQRTIRDGIRYGLKAPIYRF